MKLPTKLSLLLTILLLAGCRLGASVFEGGDVISASGDYHCLEGSTCEFTITDAQFSETFTAQPRMGFEFTRWRAGEGFLCGNSTDPVCTIAANGGAIAQAIVASDHIYYLMPEFTCVGACPKRPEINWRALDESIYAMEEARKAIEAYVANNNGRGATNRNAYGIDLATRDSAQLHRLQVYPNDASHGYIDFYITAEVYSSVWGDTSGALGQFSLSGETNSDGSMSWRCIPVGPPGSGSSYSIPVAYLPLNCRG